MEMLENKDFVVLRGTRMDNCSTIKNKEDVERVMREGL